MEDREVINFCWEWKRNWMDTDQYIRRLERSGNNLKDFKDRAVKLNVLTKGMSDHIDDIIIAKTKYWT